MPTNGSYQSASKELLRNVILDAMQRRLTVNGWSSITMSHIAKESGVSRQTVYNEFGSRPGLAQAYAIRLADVFCRGVKAAIIENVDDVSAALRDGFTRFFTTMASDPLVQSLHAGDAHPDLLRLITTDAGPLIDRAAAMLATSFTSTWMAISPDNARRTSRGIARMALSYIAMPPEGGRDVVEDMVELFAPSLSVASSGSDALSV